MKVKKSIIIDKPAAIIWKLLADDFDKADLWMANVPKSYEKESGKGANEAPMIGRICEFTTRPDGPIADETITFYDPTNYRMEVKVIPLNGNLPIIENTLLMYLNILGPNRTEVVWDTQIKLRPVGKLLYPVLRAGLGKNFTEILEELKHFSETGYAHPRKVAKMKNIA